MNYQDFIASKRFHAPDSGFECGDLGPWPRDFQRAAIKWAVRRGKAALFLDTGLGKTICELLWASEVYRHTGGNILILCPVGVRQQTKREAEKFSIPCPVTVCQSQADVKPGINVTNYERLHLFDVSSFIGVVLGEASILKAFDGTTRAMLTEKFANTPYRLTETATPAPNDTDELGNQAEFLGIMTANQVRSMFFTHDGGDTSKWRLRGWSEQKFWEWVATWAVMIRKPSDIGFSDDGYNLPPLSIVEHIVESPVASGHLFQVSADTLEDQRAARRESIQQRIAKIVQIAEANPGPRVVWCGLNDESKACTAALKHLGAVEVTGSDSMDVKEERLLGFQEGKIPIIVSKVSIAGFGSNWQHAHQMSHAGVSHSWEELYQSIRRMYRFGQEHPVTVDIVLSDREVGILDNLKRKQAEADRMAAGMIGAMSDFTRREIGSSTRKVTEYNPTRKLEIPAWLTS